MRTYGRVLDDPLDPDGPKHWVQVDTGPTGDNTHVWLTTLVQTCKLNLNESPFYADYGVPARESVMQQVAPDFFLSQISRRYQPYFASLLLAKFPEPTPHYLISIITLEGAVLNAQIPVPV